MLLLEDLWEDFSAQLRGDLQERVCIVSLLALLCSVITTDTSLQMEWSDFSTTVQLRFCGIKSRDPKRIGPEVKLGIC